jgi:hypothetical protein
MKETFDFIKDESYRYMLATAYEAITIVDLWEFMKQDIQSFMFSKKPQVWAIMEKICEIAPDVGHSGTSFGITMRQMQRVAQIGLEQYKKEYLDAASATQKIQFEE